MFQFPPLTSLAGSLPEGRGVAPFGYPRITACVRLPVAFRSFTRPSSSGDAKASTIRPCVAFAYMACTASHITMTLDLCGRRHSPAAYNRSYLLVSYESISFTMSKNTRTAWVVCCWEAPLLQQHCPPSSTPSVRYFNKISKLKYQIVRAVSAI